MKYWDDVFDKYNIKWEEKEKDEVSYEFRQYLVDLMKKRGMKPFSEIEKKDFNYEILDEFFYYGDRKIIFTSADYLNKKIPELKMNEFLLDFFVLRDRKVDISHYIDILRELTYEGYRKKTEIESGDFSGLSFMDKDITEEQKVKFLFDKKAVQDFYIKQLSTKAADIQEMVRDSGILNELKDELCIAFHRWIDEFLIAIKTQK